MAISDLALSAVITAMRMAGKTITYDRDNALTGTYNVDTGDFTPAEDEEAPEPFTPVIGRGYCDKYTQYEIDGDVIQVGDQKLYGQVVAGYIPKINDTVTMPNSIKHRIMNVYPIEAEEGIVVLYQMQLRK